MVQSMSYPGICVGGLRETTKYLSMEDSDFQN
jgi:hypothetical protein